MLRFEFRISFAGGGARRGQTFWPGAALEGVHSPVFLFVVILKIKKRPSLHTLHFYYTLIRRETCCCWIYCLWSLNNEKRMEYLLTLVPVASSKKYLFVSYYS